LISHSEKKKRSLALTKTKKNTNQIHNTNIQLTNQPNNKSTGSSSYLDVTSPSVREWWSKQFSPSLYAGSTPSLYIWNDMNEPSVFNGPEVTMGKDVLHWMHAEHRDVHNAFGYYYHLATADGLARRGDEAAAAIAAQQGGKDAPSSSPAADGDRPFVLSRAFFFGTARVGPIWTGDNAAQWSHLKVATPMLLTLGLSGLPFSGADVGGFFGNPDAELLTRFYQAGAYYPFFRGHAHLETQRREPWLFGEPTTARVREAIRGRYGLLPYFYTLFREANVSGAPILRPLWFDFPDQTPLYAAEDGFMLGPAMLVRPVVAAGAASADVTLPGGGSGGGFGGNGGYGKGGNGNGGNANGAPTPPTTTWYCARTGAEASTLPGARYVSTPATPSTSEPSQPRTLRLPVDMESIPVFIRGGSVVARRERPRRSTGAARRDPFTLVVAVDPGTGYAEGDLYLDDGSSFAFARRGAYAHRRFAYKDGVLSNKAAPPASPPPGARPVPRADPAWPGADGLRIERVVLLFPTPADANRAEGSRPRLEPAGGGGAGAGAQVQVEAGGAPDVRGLAAAAALAAQRASAAKRGPAADGWSRGSNVVTVRAAGRASLPVASDWSLRILPSPMAEI
jgi:mannosyl-oligosaccharide alpha-1,3-glucosidase